MNAGLGLGALAAAAIIEVGHPGTFQAIYLLDALSFLLYAPLLLLIPARPGAAHARDPERRTAYREVRLLRGRRRTKAVALAACTWALTWAVVLAAGRLGGGPAAATGFAVAMAAFAIGECLLSPTLPAIVNDMAPPEAQGSYNGLGTLAWTTGFIVGLAISGAALSRGWGMGLFTALIPLCGLVALLALRLGHRLLATIDTIPSAG
jgi:MFS family permease